MPKVPHVVLLLYPSAGMDRGVLKGIVRYARTHGPWIFCLAGEESGLPIPEFEAVSGSTVKTFHVSARQRIHLPDLRDWGVTGIIGRLQNRPIARLALNSGAPVIGVELSDETLTSRQSTSNLNEIKSDSYGAGRLAAEHLLERGFKDFGYCGYEGRGWSDSRQRGFTQRIEEAGFSCHVYQPSKQETTLLWQQERSQVLSWLGSLPERVGVMACNDIRGRQVLEATTLGKIAVPDQVAVVGVDDDQLLCELSNPALSSVKLNTELGGYRAAKLLDELMSGRVQGPQQIVVEAQCVVSRQSTDVIAVEDQQVATALRFIREQARQPICVKDVVKHVLVSRRGLEIRFQRALGRSIREEIQRAKLDQTKQLLLETTMPVAKIADTVGFGSVSYMSKVFRHAAGETLTQYRRRHLPE